MVGGLMQLINYGMLEPYETIYKTCFNTIPERKYNNFKIIFDDKQLGKEYYSNNLINVFHINLSKLNNKSILVNSKKIIQFNKEKLKLIIEIEKERKKEEYINCNDNVSIFKNSYRLINANNRNYRSSQNKQLKYKIKNQIKRC